MVSLFLCLYSPSGRLNYSGRDSSGSPEHGGAGEAYADGATKERPAGILAERPAGRGLQRMARDGLPGCETDGPVRRPAPLKWLSKNLFFTKRRAHEIKTYFCSN